MDEVQQAMHPMIWEKMILAATGESLKAVAEQQPVLLIFLRHFGCSFCREGLSDINKKRQSLEKKGIRVVFVHMAPRTTTAEKYFGRYKLLPIDHISDPERRYYQAFGLIRLKPAQLLTFMSFVKGFQKAVVEGHGMNNPSSELGDGFQMPGVFLLYKGQILNSYIHKREFDRPDYEEIVASCPI